MTHPRRQTWRASAGALVLVGIVLVAAVLVLPYFAYLIYERKNALAVPIGLCVLGLAVALYAWRFGLHPRLHAGPDGITVKNPFRTYRFEWPDVTVVAPGENGLVIGSPDQRAEAWCVQKSTRATRKGFPRRADDVTTTLLDLLDTYDPPAADDETGLTIRRARVGEEELLLRLERSANESALRHVFPPERYPYPEEAVRGRWARVLRNRHYRVRVLELFGAPVGYLAFTDDTVAHLGVITRQTRRGYGTALLEYATEQIFDTRVPEAQLWVLTGNVAARSFYRSARWQDTADRRRSEYPPHPEEMRMTRTNPRAPRRSRP